jgi:hypothetical protein
MQKLAEENDRIKNSMHVQEQEIHRLIVEASRDTTKRLGELQGRCGELERRVEEGEFRTKKEAGSCKHMWKQSWRKYRTKSSNYSADYPNCTINSPN